MTYSRCRFTIELHSETRTSFFKHVCNIFTKQSILLVLLVAANILPEGMRLSLYQLSERCRLFLHACYRSILELTSLSYTRAGKSERRVPPAPIRTPERSSRLSDQRRILSTQPRVMPEHERQHITPFRSLCFQ